MVFKEFSPPIVFMFITTPWSMLKEYSRAGLIFVESYMKQARALIYCGDYVAACMGLPQIRSCINSYVAEFLPSGLLVTWNSRKVHLFP